VKPYQSLLSAHGSAFHPARRATQRWFFVVAIRYYLDIAGGKPDNPVLTAAGYLATESEWRKLERTWGEILHDAGDVEHFHATEFYACKGLFSHLKWGSPRHRDLDKRFLNCGRRFTKFGFGIGFDTRTYYATMSEALARTKFPSGGKRVMDPRVYALSYALNRAAQRVLPPGTQTAVIFEHEKGIGAAIDYCTWLKEKRREGWTGAYTSFTHGGKDQRPLQAADLLAFHARARILDVLEDSASKPRERFAHLTKKNNVHLDVSLEADFRQTSVNVINFLLEHPEYAVADAFGEIQ
jgi:hypothetical protein